jgi:RecB family exonuclease
MPRKPTFSPTRIATYLECAVKYRYIYHDKIGRFYLKSRPGYSFGSTLHQVLQAYHEESRAAGAPQSVGRLVESLDQVWISAGYESAAQEAEFRVAGLEAVTAYHALALERAEGGVETLFTERTISTDMGLFRLAGRVDRVDRHPDGTLEIVDYKSGRLETSEQEVAESLAMRIYQLILRRTYPGTRVMATLCALRSCATATAEMTNAEMSAFADDIEAIGREILERDFSGVTPKRIVACEECEFRSRCETYWRWEQRNELGDL